MLYKFQDMWHLVIATENRPSQVVRLQMWKLEYNQQSFILSQWKQLILEAIKIMVHIYIHIHTYVCICI
jgi:hypothetical protein